MFSSFPLATPLDPKSPLQSKLVTGDDHFLPLLVVYSAYVGSVAFLLPQTCQGRWRPYPDNTILKTFFRSCRMLGGARSG